MWSYQCVTCKDKELCLTCVFGGDGALSCCCCSQCACGAGCAVICAGPAGFVLGHFLHKLFRGCTGLPY
uniref:Uncharacterized protein n=1 Tax=Oryza brachyantha TaxID=4533 RepID=J3MUT4_ORYBR